MDEQPPRRIDQPEPGYFQLRLTRGGPYVAARIIRRLSILCAEINGAPASLEYVWTHGEFVTPERYAALMRDPPVNPMGRTRDQRFALDRAIKEQEELDRLHTRPIR